MSSSPSAPRVWLASASPRRRELLALTGLSFTVDPADLDESQLAGESPRAYVERLARAKAQAVAARHAGDVALAADTSVVVDEEIFGKPGHDAREGARMLERLSGRAHQVLTGVAVAGARVFATVVATEVRFKRLTAQEIAWYVSTGEGHDKAGGYAVQGKAGAFIERLDGSSSSVIGLPLVETLELLRQAGVPLAWDGLR
jgi:septum formation protein